MELNGMHVTGAAGGLLAVLLVAINVVLHIIFAFGVYKLSKSGEVDGRRTWLVGPFSWAICTLVIGPFFAAVYWAIHHSSFGGFSECTLNELRQRRGKLNEES